ncbi:MAG: hypothetical protein AAF828_05860 [Bacteroidota bacterium]
MNRFSLLLSVGLLCFYWGCGNGSKKNPPKLSTGEVTVVDTATYQPLYIHKVLAESELNAKNTAQGGYGQAMLPPMTYPTAQLLTRNYWVAEFYHDSHASVEQRKRGQGQWFQFNPDGTFIGGHWDRQTHAGAWYLINDTGKTYLQIDSNVDRLDATWDVQAIGSEQEAMGWVRTTKFGPRTPKSITVKMIELFNMPTKQQFGVAE